MNKEDFIKAGRITARVREESKKWVVKGARYVDIADKIEERLKSLGAKPAFPVNISANNHAAHDTAGPGDERELESGDLVKIDLGASVNGWLGDTAYTKEIETDKHGALIKTSEDALKKAIELVKKGATLGEIGKAIGGVISKAGYNPIRNLGGHPLGEYQLHGDFVIPNYDNNSTQELAPGGIAIEPFATNGEGFVHNAPETLIYSLKKPRPVRNTIARKLLKHIVKNYNKLPFAERWIAREFKHYEYGLRVLLKEKIIHGYNILREKKGRLVSQSEHSLLLNNEVTVTTLSA
ncbi:type II methionyl aminopeptidase [archaeon]|nr:type II methionyl aminopeptidase [archaeon]